MWGGACVRGTCIERYVCCDVRKTRRNDYRRNGEDRQLRSGLVRVYTHTHTNEELVITNVTRFTKYGTSESW